MADNKKAIIQTLLYSSLFNFPLSKDELYYYLHAGSKISEKEFEKYLSLVISQIVVKDGFYTLKGNEKSFELRKKRSITSIKKRDEGLKVAKILGYIPSVLFIGISGSVAVGNAKDSDDIDFFVVTSNRSLYATRLLLLLILQLLGKRRSRKEIKPQNKICLNMLVDQNGMYFQKSSQDLYTARELVQMYPLFERGGYYQKLLAKNNWTQSLMPHAVGQTNTFIHRKMSISSIFSVLEPIAKFIEQRLIKRNQTREVATNHVIALHPNDTKNWVLTKFNNGKLHYSKYYNR